MMVRLEGDLSRSLEDSRIAGRAGLSRRDLAEGWGVQTCAGGVAEVWMVRHVETFKTQNHCHLITNGEGTAQRRIQIEELGSDEGVASDVSISSNGIRCEGGRVDKDRTIISIGLRCLGLGVDDGADLIRPIVVDVGERVIQPRGYGEGSTTGDAEKRCDLPIVDRMCLPSRKTEAALSDQGAVDDVTSI